MWLIPLSASDDSDGPSPPLGPFMLSGNLSADRQEELQKLLKRAVVLALVAGLPLAQSAHAKSKHHDDRAHNAPAMKQQNPAKLATDQRRDPADIALDKKIKSICRGC